MKKILFALSIAVMLLSCESLTQAELVELQWVISPSDNNVVTLIKDDPSVLHTPVSLTNGEQFISDVNISIGDTAIARIDKSGNLIPVTTGVTSIFVSSKEHQGHGKNGVGLQYIAVRGTVNVTQ